MRRMEIVPGKGSDDYEAALVDVTMFSTLSHRRFAQDYFSTGLAVEFESAFKALG